MELSIANFFFFRFLTFIAILCRISGLFIMSPFFGGSMINSKFKIPVVIVLSYAVLYSVPEYIPMDIPAIDIVMICAINFTFGFAAGLIANILFYGLSFAGDIYGYQLGFAAASVYDPLTESENVIVSQLVFLIGTCIFTIIKGPVILLGVILKSFDTVPARVMTLGNEFNLSFSIIMGKVLELGLEVGLPMIVFMLLVTTVLGIMSKLLPQLNVFIVGIPLKILVGMIIIIGLLPVWADIIAKYTFELSDWIWEVMAKF